MSTSGAAPAPAWHEDAPLLVARDVPEPGSTLPDDAVPAADSPDSQRAIKVGQDALLSWPDVRTILLPWRLDISPFVELKPLGDPGASVSDDSHD
jgi:hypothetical protein